LARICSVHFQRWKDVRTQVPDSVPAKPASSFPVRTVACGFAFVISFLAQNKTQGQCFSNSSVYPTVQYTFAATMPRRGSKRSRIQSQEDSDDEAQVMGEEEEEYDDDKNVMFSQQAPEASQAVQEERAGERNNLNLMDKGARDKAVSSLSRLILFKALEREPIDRLKVIKEAGLGSFRVSGALFQEAADRLRNVFGFELRRIPKYMETRKSLPARFKDRYYVQNCASDSVDGSHSKAIHSVHQGSSIERGLILLINALIFCKGESRSEGSRWILGRDLYRLLHRVDDSIPEEPPTQGTSRAKGHSKASRINNNLTPNVDALLEEFVHWDYFIKEKATDENFASQTLEEGDVLYTMGPRSAIEIGRKQVIHFCAEILDEAPCPTMLKEIEEDMDDEDEEAEEVFMEEVAA
jgi:hypothetical protein